MSQKSSYYWFINAVIIIFFAVLALTGIIIWILPHGHGSEGFLISLRHFTRDIHKWSGLVFIVFGTIHAVVHWTYIRNNLVKYGILKEKK
jgi:membrane protein implicated in regulation of membrane protease activity